MLKDQSTRTSSICAATLALVAFVGACSDGNGVIAASGGTGNTTSSSGTTSTVAGSATLPTGGSSTTTGGTGTTDGGSSTSAGTAGAGGAAGAAGGVMTGGGADGSGGSTTVDPYSGPFKILVLSKSLEFVHASIPDCQMLLRTLGQTPDAMMPQGTKPGSQFTIDVANEDLSGFTDNNLKNYGMLFWCSPTGTVFSTGGANGATGMAAIQKYVEGGGAWGGVHSATDFEKTNGFPWFTNILLGGSFDHHDNDGTGGTVHVDTAFANHPVVRGVAPTWSTQDEWYYMNRDISAQPGFQVLARLASDNRPVVWIKELGANNKGRMFYTIRGHNQTVYKEPDFKRLILNGVLWATHRID